MIYVSLRLDLNSNQIPKQNKKSKISKLINPKSHPTLLQAEEKHARNPVPKCPSKPLEPAIGQSAGWSSLQGHFGTELRARFFCSLEYCSAVLHSKG